MFSLVTTSKGKRKKEKNYFVSLFPLIHFNNQTYTKMSQCKYCVQLAGVQHQGDEPLSFANSVQRVRYLETLERSFGRNSPATSNSNIQAVGEQRRFNMNDFRPTADPKPEHATTHLGGLESVQELDVRCGQFVFSRPDSFYGCNKFPYFAPGQENALLRYS